MGGEKKGEKEFFGSILTLGALRSQDTAPAPSPLAAPAVEVEQLEVEVELEVDLLLSHGRRKKGRKRIFWKYLSQKILNRNS